MFVKSIVAVALLTSFVAAQTSNNSTLDASTVPLTTRAQWCQAQTNTCGTLCSGELNTNTCDPAFLTFNCTCASNSSSPGLQYYKETMQTFICEQIFQNCIKAGENDQAAQTVCEKNEKANCGQLSPEKFVAPVTTSSSASATASPTGTPSGASGASTGAPTSSSKAAGATLMPLSGQSFGTGAVAVGIAAAFGYML